MRLDAYLVRNGLVESREKAKYLIRGDHVKINGVVFAKPAKEVKEGDKIEISGNFEYVGRGGYKLAPAAERFGIDFGAKIVADVGCSTGGFTDYAVKHCAKRVYAIDIGDELHPSLCVNRSVVYMPGFDALKLEKISEPIDICLIDVTFVPLKKMLEVVKGWLAPGGEVIALIKPPFEKEGKAMKVNDSQECKRLAKEVAGSVAGEYEVLGLVESELEGKTGGQREFFIHLRAV
jgi:23S rRNA (cytidine1920-2'-O)/16S rRNA (cytidine1409-2'-O)-methyltransferase